MAELGDKTWPEWIDALGNYYGPGDIVAVSTINGKSPQLVIARVERINKVNSYGEVIKTRKFFEHPEPIMKPRKCRLVGEGDYYERYYPNHVCEKSCTEYLERGEYREVSSCTIQATPLVDSRGFGRYGKNKETGANKKVTYSIPENIILIERADESDSD